MHTFKCLSMVMLGIGLVLVSCRDQRITGIKEKAGREMVINLPGINQVSIRGENRDVISVAELLRLRIQQAGLEDQLYTVELTPQDSIIRFEEVVIESESAVVSAEIRSNNGTQIYSGSSNLAISDNEFDLEVELDAVSEILAAGSDSMAINLTDTMWVFNKGVESLLWEITDQTSDPEDYILEFDPSRGELLPDSSAPVTIYSQVYDMPINYTVRIESPVGHVDLNLKTNVQ